MVPISLLPSGAVLEGQKEVRWYREQRCEEQRKDWQQKINA